MSLRFYFGPSDGALSKKVYKDIIERSLEHPEQNFLIIVPDQFTMQTQKELAVMHPRGGILNIDVLSFGRLSHRVLEEVGSNEIPVLDDTGKSLVLQKVAAGLKDKLPVLGGFLQKQGYIHEVKSAISEFMQYGLSPEDVGELTEYAKDRGALAAKLKDLQTVYAAFSDYIHEKFITAEETLDVLCRNLPKSKIVKGSVIVLDGFTGFTPIQNRLIRQLMNVGSEVILTLVCGSDEDPYRLEGEQKLFYLTQKTVHDLEKIAKEDRILRDRREDIFLKGSGDEEKPSLHFLGERLFRYGGGAFRGNQQEIRIYETTNPAQEVRQSALFIQQLIRQQNLAYRDIVLISGNLEGYAPYVEAEFQKAGIPCFIDRTRGIVLNPLTEFIKSLLQLYLKNFSYEAVLHYLRSGLTGIPLQEADLLENYILETGIRGQRAYNNRFTKKTAHMPKEDEIELENINAIREKLMAQIAVFGGGKKDRAKNYVDRLYEFLTANQVQSLLAKYENEFLEAGDTSKAREYAQIYRLVMDLLNQVYGLLGEEEISLQEFAEILEAGFGEIEVGIIPQNVDRVLVGDMERTRFKPVKVLFFLGVNDGNIPRNTSKGGIISDMEREFLKDSQYDLAPTPRQQMFIQRFYLYLNMTKPSQALFLSYSRQGNDGKSLRPAYLIETMKKMFPGLKEEYPENRPVIEQMMTPAEGSRFLAEGLRNYAAGLLDEEREKAFFSLYEAFGKQEYAQYRERYAEAAFAGYKDSPLPVQVARLIYGEILENSVSRLEVFAGCAYRHFLEYGLSLKERAEFGFESTDLGNLYHGVLEIFSHKMEQDGKTWFDFEEDYARQVVVEAMENLAAQYGNSVLFSSKRNAYQIKRMERVLVRTVLTLQKQLKKGVFRPRDYEVSFHQAKDLESVKISLSENEKMMLRGRIDRVDVAEDDEHIYVKIVDYKSGDRKFDLVALYYGLQLQLVVYMNAAMEREKKKNPKKEVVPAALLYYHVDDPVVESTTEMSQEELDREILKSLKTRGIVNADGDVVKYLDGEFTDKSDVIPVERKKDKTYSSRSAVMSSEEIAVMSSFVNRKLQAIGREIMKGKISLNPYERGDEEACTYCPYAKVCGFDKTIPGCKKRKLTDMDRADILSKMKEEQ